MIRLIEKEECREKICIDILKRLPEWFEREDGILQYANKCRQSLFMVYFENDKPVGFIAVKETSSVTIEISVMGVLEKYQRKGIGCELFKTIYDYAKCNNYEFIQVKTVKEGKYISYDKTNHFYKKIGFKEFECIEDLWDKDNPCQIYVMSIK